MTKSFTAAQSLNTKMLRTMLLSLLCAVAVFFIARLLGGLFIERVYMSSSAVEARKSEIYKSFSAYVAQNRISGNDRTAVARWTEEYEYVTILIYKGSDLNMRAYDGKADPASNIQNYERMQYASEFGKLYPMRFADGVYQIAISDKSVNGEYTACNITAVFLASFVFVVMIMGYVHSLTRRIILLSKEAVEVGAGDLDREISTEGNDELSMLACEMDNMRRSVIERMGNESRAWKANSELITAISHDIRTPMTTMIGYLGLLKDGEDEPPERREQFTSAAYDKAMELKELTDELFKYFLIFGKSGLEMEIEQYDARLLLEQFLSETEFELKEAGFRVSNIEFEGECFVRADPMYLKRVLDNLVSNIKKYADKNRVVMFISELKDDKLSLCVSNYIAKSMDRVESTKIGLRTCAKIMEHMGGSFLTRSDEEHFAVECTLPAIAADMEERMPASLHSPQ